MHHPGKSCISRPEAPWQGKWRRKPGTHWVKIIGLYRKSETQWVAGTKEVSLESHCYNPALQNHWVSICGPLILPPILNIQSLPCSWGWLNFWNSSSLMDLSQLYQNQRSITKQQSSCCICKREASSWYLLTELSWPVTKDFLPLHDYKL